MTGYQEEEPLELGLAARTIREDLSDVELRALRRLQSARGYIAEETLELFEDREEIREALESLRGRNLTISLRLDGSTVYVLAPLGIIVAKISGPRETRATRPLGASPLS
jgi:hypothetical protein